MKLPSFATALLGGIVFIILGMFIVRYAGSSGRWIVFAVVIVFYLIWWAMWRKRHE